MPDILSVVEFRGKALVAVVLCEREFYMAVQVLATRAHNLLGGRWIWEERRGARGRSSMRDISENRLYMTM